MAKIVRWKWKEMYVWPRKNMKVFLRGPIVEADWTERSSGYWREKNREGERARGETDNPEFWGWIERVNMAAWNEWLVVVGNCRDASETSSCIFDFIFNGKGKEGSITIEQNEWASKGAAVAKGDDESMLKRKMLSYSLVALKIIISGWCQFYSSIPTDSTFRSDIVINMYALWIEYTWYFNNILPSGRIIFARGYFTFIKFILQKKKKKEREVLEW